MFDDIYGIARQCAENFSSGVHDAFGASIVTNVLDPIINELASLRSLNEEFNRLSLEIDQVLQEVRSLHLDGGNID